MAKARVGGTKGMLSGQVGSTIYQIKKNDNGTYTQYAYSKGERTETTFTPKLQAQRMCVGMVESLMKQLKPLVSISFQAGKNKTASCNSFSAANLRLVRRDCQDHWNSGNVFVFPIQYRGYPDFSELGGPYMISSGSLSFNLFDTILFDDYPPANWQSVPYPDGMLWGMEFDCRLGVETVGTFRSRHRMTVFDKMCFAGFRTWIEDSGEDDDPLTLSKHDYIIASFNLGIAPDTVITAELLPELFKYQSNIQPEIYVSRDNSRFVIGKCLNYAAQDEMYYYWTAFSVSNLTGKKQISTSFYSNEVGADDPYLLHRQPSMVFGSWMGEPSVKPWPSPW